MIQRRWFARLRYGAAALLFFLCFWLTPMQTEAATDGMLTIICKDGDTILPNLTWKLYRVGSYSSSAELLLEGDFADYPVNGKLTTTAEVQDAADTLANLTVVDAIAPLSTGKTDQSGAVTFAPLETGAYLITGKPVVVGNKRYIPAPALLYLTEESGSDTFQWNIYPKFTVKPFSTSSTVRYSVEKVWLHDEGMTMNRPEDLVIQLYCDDVMREEVTLNEANGWSYSWEGNSLEEWHVKELVVPENYLVVYKQNDTQFLIFNSHNQTGSQELTTAPITTTTTTETTTTTFPTTTSETTTTVPTTSEENPDTTTTEPIEMGIYGDVDGNGIVDVSDAVAVLTYYAKRAAGLEPIFGETPEENEAIFALADVDQDGIITVQDAVYILMYYAQKASGMQPTWEELTGISALF